MERPILIQVAMKVECEKLLKKIENIKEKEIKGYKFYEGTINNYKIVLLLSNVGLIQTSASLMLAINEYNPIAIINMGIAGSTSPNLHIKDIIIGTECLNINSYKTSIKEKNKGSDSINWELLTFLSGEEDKLIIEQSDKELIELTKKINIDSNVYYGRIGSGDCWNREIDKIISLNEKYKIVCEDMESIAVYTISNQFKIPVISIKCISDNVLTGEEYDRTVGSYIQEYIFNYIKILIDKFNY